MPKRNPKVKPVSFRVYPEGTFLYAEVNIWPTKKAMRAHTGLPRNAEASCGGRELYIVPPEGPRRKLGLFAEANFYKRAMGIGVVSHEMSHAAFCFAERRGLKLEQANCERASLGWRRNNNPAVLDQDGVEERFCYALGEMCRQFTQKCYDLGLYSDVVTSKT